ncbi:MAG: sugar transferase [Chitinispirillaceae bacterium]|nr:sugar transferase [Chitinispirillaceae bacterium]
MKVKHDKNIHLPVGAGTDGLYSQELFRDLLVHERKRSERSRKHFFFVALDIKEVLTSTSNDIQVVSAIIKAIATSSREVDVKGWYEDPICIGVIYTEVGASAIEQILEKIKQKLASALKSDLASRIGITYSIFPEEDGKQWTQDRSSEAKLYPANLPQTLQKKGQLLMKRALDIVASSVGIVALSPLLFAIGLLIKTTSRGPIVFKQERIGLGGKKFGLYKFRSMYANNDSAIHQEFVKKLIAGQAAAGEVGESASYKIQNDPRVTAVGRFIRKTSIDELPQLFNVLVGSMSLVGPRPPIGYEVEVYEVWHRPRVVDVKPGITGLWQVKGRSKTTFEGMVRMDLEYIHNWSFWLDVQLLFKTPAAVMNGKGAY